MNFLVSKLFFCFNQNQSYYKKRPYIIGIELYKKIRTKFERYIYPSRQQKLAIWQREAMLFLARWCDDCQSQSAAQPPMRSHALRMANESMMRTNVMRTTKRKVEPQWVIMAVSKPDNFSPRLINRSFFLSCRSSITKLNRLE